MDGDGLAALAGDGGHHPVGSLFAGAVVDRNRGTFGGEASRDLGADALRRAGDQRHFAFEFTFKFLGHTALHDRACVLVAASAGSIVRK